jgi:hypothetical protein
VVPPPKDISWPAVLSEWGSACPHSPKEPEEGSLLCFLRLSPFLPQTSKDSQ